LTRQHSTPLLLTSGVVSAVALTPLGQRDDDLASEANIHALVHAHPECLPIAEIDRMFLGPVPICTELNTQAARREMIAMRRPASRCSTSKRKRPPVSQPAAFPPSPLLGCLLYVDPIDAGLKQ
jgi:hypothetical protein